MSVLAVADLAPLYYAIDRHLFGDVVIEPVTSGSGPASVAKLTSGDVDIAYSSYSAFFVAQAQKVVDLKIVSDGSAAPPGRQALVTHERSPVRSVHDMDGKRVGISAKNSMSHLLTLSVLRDNGVDGVPDGAIQWVETDFAKIGPLLEKGGLDAAYLPEPFLSMAIANNHVRPFADPASGPTLNIPINGFAATTPFIGAHREVVKQFVRGMKAATDKVAGDRNLANEYGAQAVVTAPSPQQMAAMIDVFNAMPTIPTFMAGVPKHDRLQRIPDLMVLFHALANPMDAATVLDQSLDS